MVNRDFYYIIKKRKLDCFFFHNNIRSIIHVTKSIQILGGLVYTVYNIILYYGSIYQLV